MGDIGINATTSIIENLKKEVSEQPYQGADGMQAASDRRDQGADACGRAQSTSLRTVNP